MTGTENVWRQFDQVVCPVDSIKPIERRRGWSNEKLESYNQERLGDLIDAGWDLIICDEAHRLGGSTEQVARYRLGKSLAEAAPYLLLLSATPHQGKTGTEKGSDPENAKHPSGRSGFRGLTPFPAPRIPFEHEDIRAYVDTLFLEGSLRRSLLLASAQFLIGHTLAYGKMHRVTQSGATTA